MIKIKRIFSGMLTVALLAGLCGCGKTSPTTGFGSTAPDSVTSNPIATNSTASTNPTSAEVETPTPSETMNPEATTDPEFTFPSESAATAIEIDIPWTDVTYAVKDSSGYTFDITLHLSPWILLSDTDLINSAWDEVSGGKTLPQFDDWGFTRSGSEYRSSLPFYERRVSQATAWYMTDMYYSVGTVTIKNTTSGFDVTQNDPKAVTFPWGHSVSTRNSGGYVQWSAGRILYSDDVVTRINGLYISASMNNNVWGPVPVILITSEYISPNTPDGLSKDILSDDFVFYRSGALGNVFLESENTQVHLGILKSDGEYIT